MTLDRPLFALPDIALEPLPEGGMMLRSRVPLNPAPRSMGVWLAHWAEQAPERCFLAERSADGAWRRLSYGEAFHSARAIGTALLQRGLGPERPVAILSENGIDHGLLMLGAMEAGVPVAPISPAYSLLSRDFAKLRYTVELLRPALIYVNDGARFVAALMAIGARAAEIVASVHPPPGAMDFAQLQATKPSAALDAASRTVGPDTIAKILFTSGSTGEPKGVINTQRMLCSNQEAIAQLWPFVAERPPVLVDWLPWNHTFGGNHNFNLVLRNGGTLYIDEGRPVPALIERTIANLRAVSPTLYLNVPRGYAMVVDHLERDPALAAHFLRELDLIMYAAAALPQPIWERFERLSLQHRHVKIPMASAWGATETAPMATAVHYPIEGVGNVGNPAPGCEIKLVLSGDRLEVRVRGPQVTPGYWKQPELTAAAFDEEGFYRPSDAMRLADPADPARGLIFDGRIAENFKLSTGTWVGVGELRVAAIAACGPAMEDGVITGENRDEIGLLIFPSLAGCRSLCPDLPLDVPLARLIADPRVRASIADGLKRHNATAGGSARHIARALLMAEPPSIDSSEITDKGYLNQRACLVRRAKLVEALYRDPPPPEVIRA